jgi:hypothetical protein
MRTVFRRFGGNALLTALALAGCANGMTAALDQAFAPYMPVPTAADCDATNCTEMRRRAHEWLVKHSKWKIQAETDALIQSYDPATFKSATYGFDVRKEPTGDRKFSIRIDMTCGDPFRGCMPIEEQVRRAFVYYVLKGKDILDQFPRYSLQGIN